MTILVTGAAGFIGKHVSELLLARGDRVIGIDNLNDYYDVGLKRARLALLQADKNFTFYECNIADQNAIDDIFTRHPDITGIINLAAQAGVRYSLENPYIYVQSNVMGPVVLMQAALKLKQLKHFAFASSSSVYGSNTKLPFSVDDRVDNPISLYAATKKSNELLAHTYAHLYQMPLTGLRFFSVYGPWGRPDMAAYLFADKIMRGETIQVFNHGNMQRDFTYIDDIAAGIVRVLDTVPTPDNRGVPFRVYNLGNNRSEKLSDFIALLEQSLGRVAHKDMLPMQPGDVPATFADIDASVHDFGFSPTTPIAVGIPKFVAWYKDYHNHTMAA